MPAFVADTRCYESLAPALEHARAAACRGGGASVRVFEDQSAAAESIASDCKGGAWPTRAGAAPAPHAPKDADCIVCIAMASSGAGTGVGVALELFAVVAAGEPGLSWRGR
eukprot:439327-Prymnesium_polylepis.1